ncbi:glutathione S-transferase family protein [Candidatus Cyanaurora vandensis]|uniref:glutathione S-transferase family protein n=1 Tax=Candidatus Cyanaurora vandensis TaxID=2714958 RepID=UPI00257F97B7|nr:glutathione S-transferase N-terminal domain-containing protein [Candidatus Cyanaurora vandensis]
MFDLYTAQTPNGHKVAIALEELTLPYQVHLVDIFQGEQFKPEFLQLNPNHQIPVLVNSQMGETLFESGAILLYLAELTGQLLPVSATQRHQSWQWLFFEGAVFGPTVRRLALQRNQLSHLDPAVIDPVRGEQEVMRLFGVLEGRLDQDYIAGDYSVADISLWPWVNLTERLGLSLVDFPRLVAWRERVRTRPAVLRGLQATQPIIV